MTRNNPAWKKEDVDQAARGDIPRLKEQRLKLVNRTAKSAPLILNNTEVFDETIEEDVVQTLLC